MLLELAPPEDLMSLDTPFPEQCNAQLRLSAYMLRQAAGGSGAAWLAGAGWLAAQKCTPRGQPIMHAFYVPVHVLDLHVLM